MKHLYHEIDVFTAVPLKGNPLAVVHGADDVSDDDMLAFARWTNFSETTFLLAPTDPNADYRVRIFTPGGELPFAGHPTLGSCWAWLAAGGHPRSADVVVQECGVGLVTVKRDASRLAFAAPPPLRTGPLESDVLDQVVAALRIAPDDVLRHQWVDNGPGWCAVLLGSAAQVRALEPDFAVMDELAVGAVGPCPEGEPTAFEVRAFTPKLPPKEDPVTGSLNASVAQWLIGEGIAPENYVAAQGSVLGRAGRVHIARDGDTVWVGGDVTPIIVGEVDL